MKKLAAAALAGLLSIGAVAADDKKPELQPRTDSPIASGMPNQLTVRDCLTILAGLSNLDSRRVQVNKGKPNESVETLPYQFKGAVRDSISHDIFLLGPVQQEAQAADRRIREEVLKTKPVEVGSKDEAAQRAAQEAALATRVEEFSSRPCKVELDKIADADLKLDENDIPGTILAAIWRIRVK